MSLASDASLAYEADGNTDFLNLSKGLVAGLMEEARYATDVCRLNPEPSVLLYTDGVTEAANPGGELYSETRFLDAVREGNWRSMSALVDTVKESVDRFAQHAPQPEDITLLALRYHGG